MKGIPFAPGVVVEVLSGTRKAQRGVVVGEARSMYRGVPDVEVRFEDGMVRCMRADYLREMRVPAATASDDDVMSPLRRVTSGGP